MNYWEFSFTYTSTIEADIINDILAAELGEIGFESFVPHENGLMAYIPVNLFQTDLLNSQLNKFPLPEVVFQYTQSVVEQKNWNEVWEKNYFQPIRIDKTCLIRAPFHPEEKGFQYEIIIDPKMAFGTGNHATTKLMIQEILGLDLSDSSVLDMGCGTGVLAILAAKKGAKRVVAIDNDEWAYKNTIENCHLNGTPAVQILHGGAECLNNLEPFDYILANINRNILIDDMFHYAEVLKSKGILFMSGFYKEDLPMIEKACISNNLILISFHEMDNWVAVKVKKDKDFYSIEQ